MLKVVLSLNRSAESVCTLTLSGWPLSQEACQSGYQISLPAHQSEVNARSHPCFRVGVKGAAISGSSTLHQLHSLVARNIECWCDTELSLGTLTELLTLWQCVLISATGVGWEVRDACFSQAQWARSGVPICPLPCDLVITPGACLSLNPNIISYASVFLFFTVCFYFKS